MASGVDDLKLLSTDRIEQSAVPTAMAWYPQLTKESFILVANDQVGGRLRIEANLNDPSVIFFLSTYDDNYFFAVQIKAF